MPFQSHNSQKTHANHDTVSHNSVSMKHAAQQDSCTKDAYNISWENDFSTCSATDCTGLIPSLPQDASQMEHYEQLYPFLSPTVKNQKDAP